MNNKEKIEFIEENVDFEISMENSYEAKEFDLYAGNSYKVTSWGIKNGKFHGCLQSDETKEFYLGLESFDIDYFQK